ncbi:MAG: hypothetical protein LC797_13265 [Chloroflexi bacterium]|nr:hypothetical protein [Chloroflexota bacterium]
MWRTYVICVLIGLLLVSTGGNVLLTRQMLAAQADADRLRQRLANVPTPGAAAVPVPAPTIAASVSDRALLQQIEDQVAVLRGLQPKSQVPLRFLDQGALQQYFVDRFNQDYLPAERESDQKLLTTLGLIKANESVVQTLLDVLQEQVIGLYNPDDKIMYLVADNGQFGPDEKATFAHEYTHAQHLCSGSGRRRR